MRLSNILNYDLQHIPTVEFIPNHDGQSSYSGIRMTKLKKANFVDYVNNSKMTFIGYRITPYTPFVMSHYSQTITLQTPNGMVVASTLYIDKGISATTVGIKSLKCMILNGTGIYKDKTWMNIYFDNNGAYNRRRIEIL